MHTGPQTGSLADGRWRTRLARASELRDQHPSAAAVLDFCVTVLEFQREVAAATRGRMTSGSPLREQIDLKLAAEHFPAILHLTIERGPELLATRAASLRTAGETEWLVVLQSAIAPEAPLNEETASFFARVCLQPIAENLQVQVPEDPNYTGRGCPVCFARPQMAVLRPEGEGARRSLSCSFCLREWIFRRVVCPYCGEETKEKLPHYSAAEFPHVRVQACDTCRRYLKAVDLSIDGHAVPLVDEVALAVLDVWAAERGYKKIVPNLMGF